MIKKDEIVKYLTENNIKYDEKMPYFSLLKFYKKRKKEIDNIEYVKVKKEDLYEIVYPEYDEKLYEKGDIYFDEEKKIFTYRLIPKEKPIEAKTREQVLQSILEFMPSIMNKSQGTHNEVNKMMKLYNMYFQTQEKATCAQCVSNVFNRLVKLYKKYK